eukprot:CAMPEP_0118658528 /NCGR_PEP_ID=MMETSP0785-20121206/14618_1 /TAXON_ID=91992 /ORGANISM="Bolidomonas pacifica, Strain CCMP 1866" /LENGTH=593 /DNA_ID=CAMNT_0006551555 /DNA_START=336 /DNA_END=2117 /DNA_ORIENTATION=-
MGSPTKFGDHSFGEEISRMFEEEEVARMGRKTGGSTSSSPEDLTEEECKLLNYFSSITVDLKSVEEKWACWSMVGGGKPGVGQQEQLSFTAIRYHSSFLCYAVCSIVQRTPAFRRRGGEILEWCLEELLLDPKVFDFYRYYWPEQVEGGGVFECRENIMWSGHVLHVASLYEMLTGDDKYSRAGGLKAEESDGTVSVTLCPQLALHLAACMRINRCGGVPCEPGLVFFQCQNHPFCAFTLLEGLGYFAEGFFNEEKRRFERFAVEGMRAVVETGGLKIACVTTRQNGPQFDAVYERERTILDERVDAGASFVEVREDIKSPSRVLGSLPFAHLGSDAWDLNYFYYWSTSVKAVEKIYYDFVKGKVDELRESGSWRIKGKCCKGGGGGGKWNSPPPAVCCFGLNIPKSAWSSAIFPVLIQAKDEENAEVVGDWLRRELRMERGDKVWLEESCEWSIGNTANYAMAVAMRNGSDCRAFHRGEMGVEEDRAYVSAVEPKNLAIWRCREGGGNSLEIGFTGDSASFVVERRRKGKKFKVAKLEEVGGVGELELTWEERDGRIIIRAETSGAKGEEKKQTEETCEGGKRNAFVIHLRR